MLGQTVLPLGGEHDFLKLFKGQIVEIASLQRI
jgi:hypothetical protein